MFPRTLNFSTYVQKKLRRCIGSAIFMTATGARTQGISFPRTSNAPLYLCPLQASTCLRLFLRMNTVLRRLWPIKLVQVENKIQKTHSNISLCEEISSRKGQPLQTAPEEIHIFAFNNIYAHNVHHWSALSIFCFGSKIINIKYSHSYSKEIQRTSNNKVMRLVFFQHGYQNL